MIFLFLDNNALNSNERYNVRLHVGIDNVKLPIPLKLSSLENDWNIVSEWYERDITP